MKAFRITLAVLLALTAALFLYVAMTVPAFAATAPALLGLAAAAVAWFVWPRRKAQPPDTGLVLTQGSDKTFRYDKEGKKILP